MVEKYSNVIKNPTDSRLYLPNKKVKFPLDAWSIELMKTLCAMNYIEQGAGLAAPQIGLNLQMCCVATPQGQWAIFNPRIVGTADWSEANLEWKTEGCLSHPGIWGEVCRLKTVDVIIQTLENPKPKKYTFTEHMARVIFHETDHLRGKLFTDLEQHVRNIKIDPIGQLELQQAVHATELEKDI